MKAVKFSKLPGIKTILRALPNSTYIFVVLFVGFVIAIPNFGSATNISTLLGQACILMILSSAMSLAIMTGGDRFIYWRYCILCRCCGSTSYRKRYGRNTCNNYRIGFSSTIWSY